MLQFKLKLHEVEEDQENSSKEKGTKEDTRQGPQIKRPKLQERANSDLMIHNQKQLGRLHSIEAETNKSEEEEKTISRRAPERKPKRAVTNTKNNRAAAASRVPEEDCELTYCGCAEEQIPQEAVAAPQTPIEDRETVSNAQNLIVLPSFQNQVILLQPPINLQQAVVLFTPDAPTGRLNQINLTWQSFN